MSRESSLLSPNSAKLWQREAESLRQQLNYLQESHKVQKRGLGYSFEKIMQEQTQNMILVPNFRIKTRFSFKNTRTTFSLSKPKELSDLSVEDLENLEGQLETSLKGIRTKKVQKFRYQILTNEIQELNHQGVISHQENMKLYTEVNVLRRENTELHKKRRVEVAATNEVVHGGNVKSQGGNEYVDEGIVMGGVNGSTDAQGHDGLSNYAYAELLKTEQLRMYGDDDLADKSYFFSSVCLKENVSNVMKQSLREFGLDE
ncbi:MADS-box transcription factor 27 [Camellia lanceoleosa]|uniref:MADS-box transcription factor 27 n=1 Tax=Camellia lanceoleosa TaxID=1840588 RepID=A0ACC0FSJ1_9ERIC|nr:MADS-box transcription factor 27 [Camellia lanceoleosa]